MFDGTGHRHSRAVVTTPSQIGGASLVLACGYNGTEYGYFICTETEKDGLYYYSNQLEFFRKLDETTFNIALTRLDQLVTHER